MAFVNLMPAIYLTFTRTFDWYIPQYRGAVMKQFKANNTYQVTREQNEAALAAGAARKATRQETEDVRRRRA